MELLSMPPVSQRCQFCILSLCFLCSVTIFLMLLFEGIFSPSHPFLSYLVFACRPFPIQLLVHAHIVCSSSSKLSSIAEFLVLVYGGCPNALLLVDSIPSNSKNLFWNMDLESIECLKTCSHQWKVLSPSKNLGIH